MTAYRAHVLPGWNLRRFRFDAPNKITLTRYTLSLEMGRLPIIKLSMMGG